MVAAKLNLGPTNEDDAYINPHRLQRKSSSLRGINRNFKAMDGDDSVFMKNKGNKIKTETQQHRELDRKDSNIFVRKGMWS